MTDLFPVARLRERYGIGKQAEINRRKHLRIKTSKIEGSYYVTDKQLKLLDALDHWLTDMGGKMSDFDPQIAVDSLDSNHELARTELVEATPTDYQEATLIESEEATPDWEDLIGRLAEKLQPAQSPLDNWRELEEAAQKGWLLTTRQVREIAGAKPKGQQWQRGAFTFRKAGKIGRETAWEVEKKV